ncbi:MAG: hypothetical protein IGS39_20300 [Calothrix sp. C42_A2020_038]|nr:hypothetical protein [Calothrix sp. C42_A2020_038]
MPARKMMFSLAIAAMVTLPAGMANASDLEIQTGNVQMSLDVNGGVFIRTAPGSPVIVNPIPNQNRRIRVNRNPNVKCRNVTRRNSSTRDGNRIFTQSTTSICN